MNKLFLRLLVVTAVFFCSVQLSSAQTWITSSAVLNGIGYDASGGTYYRSTAGGAATINTGLTSCNGSTATIQMGSSLFIFKPTVAITGITIHGNSGTGSSRSLSAVATATTITGTYTAVSGASATGNLSGSQATNVCSPSPMVISFGTTIAAGTFIRVTLSGNAYIATLTLAPSCTTPTAYTVSGTNSICSGASTNVLTSGSQSGVTYELYKDGTATGTTQSGTGSGLSFSVSPTSGATYTVRTTTAGGFCATTLAGSAVISLKTNVGITSVTAPASSICPAATQTLTANGVAGTNAVVTWWTGAGGTGTNLGTGTTLTNQGPGTYYARVTGDCGTPAEASITVSALTPPSITAENLPGATYTQGDPADPLSVTASGDGTLSYQWYRSDDASTGTAGDDIPVGSNSNSYTPLTTTTSTYYYYVKVSGCAPPATSSVSGAIVVEAPTVPTIVKDETGFNSAFGNQAINTVSAERSFIVSGSNLTADITVTASDGFEVSLSSGSGFASSVAIPQSGGAVTNVTVYVHFAPLSPGTYTGSIMLTSTDAADVEVVVTGTGVVPSVSLGSTADMNFSVTGWTNSASQSTSITGTNLTGNITATVGAPFELSTTGSGGWSTSVSYTPSSGNVSGNLFVRYNPSSGTGINSSTVTVSSAGTTDQTINVSGKAAPAIVLSSGSATQSVKAGVAITNIVYTVTGGVVSASASPLPSNVTFNNGTYTISGTPGTETTYPGIYNYTVTVVGPAGTSNATASGTITVTDPNALNIAYVINTALSANDQVRTFLATKHNLTNFTIASVTTATDFSAYDLVILTELPSSGSAGMKALWGINKPLLNMKAFATQANTWAFTGASGVDVTGSTQLDVIDATHPIFSGVTISAGKITMLSGIGTDKGIQATTYTGGTKLAYISGSTTNVAINEIAVGSEPNGATTVSGVKNEVSQAKYLQIGLADISWNNLTTDGFKMIDNAVMYLTHNTIMAIAGANGTISPAGASFFNNGDNQTYTITPAACYSIASLTVDGSPASLTTGSFASGGTYVFSNITGNHTISVTFAVNTFNVTVTAGANGTITPGTGTANCGSDATYTITPDAGYSISDVTVDGTPATSLTTGSYAAGGTYVFSNVSADHTISATFVINCINAAITSATASPAGPLCSGQTTNLTANGVAGTNAVVTWYTGPGGTGVNLGTGTTLNNVGANTYYARVTADCGSPAEASVTVGSVGNTFSGTGNWTDNARWSCGAPPSSGDAVTIAAGANATLNTDFVVSGSFIMTATSSLTVNPGKTLSVDVGATANFAGQPVTLKSDASGTAAIGQVNGTVSGATNFTVERYVPNNGFRSWRLLSVPVTSSQTIRQAWQEGDANPNPKDNNVAGYGTQITGVFTTQAAAAAAGFDSTSVQAAMLRWNGNAWSNITSTNQAINNFNSYFLYIRGDRGQTVTGATSSSSATTLRTKGAIYTGDQVNSVGANAFALIPNLYPSAISFAGLTRTGGVNNLFYIWDSKKINGTSLGTYQTFSATNGFNCMISGGSYVLGQPNTVIESGQSFFVTSSTAGTITLKESAKVSGTNGSLGFRPSGPTAKLETRLYNSIDEMLDANTVVFDKAFDKDISEEDAPKMGNPGANIAIEKNSKLLAVEGTQPVTDKEVIQFRTWNLQPGTYKLEFAVTNMNDNGLTAMLQDSYLKTSAPVNMQGTTSVNVVIDQNAASASPNRFRIAFNKVKSTNANSQKACVISPNPVVNGIMNVKFNNQPAGKYSVRIMNASGAIVKQVLVSHTAGTALHTVQLPANSGKGAYTVEITDALKQKQTQVILIQ